VALLLPKARAGRLGLRVNSLATAGAILSLVSLLTAWEVVERGYDWSASLPYSLLLLFTYPVSLITPLASIGQSGVLVYSALYAYSNDANIEPAFGYMVAWIAVALMIGGVIMPRLSLKNRARAAFAETVLTVTVRRTGRT